MPRTKIVCTLGPACDAPGILQEMVRAGMDVARINFSHGDHAAHARRIAEVRRHQPQPARVLPLLEPGRNMTMNHRHDAPALMEKLANHPSANEPAGGYEDWQRKLCGTQDSSH